MKERSTDDYKQVWNIEMNDARASYLGMYNKVDYIAHLTQNCHM